VKIGEIAELEKEKLRLEAHAKKHGIEEAAIGKEARVEAQAEVAKQEEKGAEPTVKLSAADVKAVAKAEEAAATDEPAVEEAAANAGKEADKEESIVAMKKRPSDQNYLKKSASAANEQTSDKSTTAKSVEFQTMMNKLP
jgi:ribosomal protein L21